MIAGCDTGQLAVSGVRGPALLRNDVAAGLLTNALFLGWVDLMVILWPALTSPSSSTAICHNPGYCCQLTPLVRPQCILCTIVTMHSLMTYRQLLTTPLRSSFLSTKPRSTFTFRPFHCSAIMSGATKACCQYDIYRMVLSGQWPLTTNPESPLSFPRATRPRVNTRPSMA